MSAKVEKTSISGAVTAPASTAGGVKISKLATKSGFLIPKNKLSGSLIPIFRGSKKGSADPSKEEDDKRVQRKTKWGPDLTQDTAVKKGRALAYQFRVDQITQELTLGKLETVDSQDLSSTSQSQDHSSSEHQLKSEELELLKLEKREAIGEILRLNPSYKAPADYKPVPKEAKVPFPVTEYPGQNFSGLILGPANDTHRRLEKETGAKIRVYGKKADTGLEVQVSTADGSDTYSGYSELYVYVTADTYEKVDAAVALIELLFMPVSGTPSSVSVSGENVNGTAPGQDTPSSGMPASAVNAQQNMGSGSAVQPNNFPQSGAPWFSGANQMHLIPAPGFAGPGTSNFSQRPPPLYDPSMFGPRSGFSPAMQHQYMPQPPSLSHSGAPRNMFTPVSQPSEFPLPAPSFRPVTSLPQAPASSGNAVPWGPSPTAPHLSLSPVPQPSVSHSAGVPFFNPNSNSQMRPSLPQVPISNSLPAQSGHPSATFNTVNPPYMTGVRPPQPSSSDFTFQPHRPQNLEFEVANRPDFRPALMHPNQSGLPPRGSSNPFLQPGIQNMRPPLPAHGFSRPNAGNPMMHQPAPQPLIQQRNFNNMAPPPPMVNATSGFPRPLQFQQNHHGFGPPNHQFLGNAPFNRPPPGSYRPHQVYDPFSPTSAQLSNSNGGNMQRQDSDPEYEDLMASVGVK